MLRGSVTVESEFSAGTTSDGFITRPAHEWEMLHTQIRVLTEQLNAFKKKLFGSDSEKISQISGLTLFDPPAIVAEPVESEAAGIEVPAHVRRKGKRKPFGANLERIERVIDLPAESKIRGDCGEAMTQIGADVSERAEIIPPKIFVEKLVRPKCVCRKCNGAPVAAPLPYVLPHAIAGNGLFAHVVTSKFCDAIPFYRLEGILSRYGIDFSAANMSNNIQQFHERYGDKLLVLLEAQFRKSALLHIDETTIQVMREPDRSNKKKSYVWTLRGEKVVIFSYRTTRNADFLLEMLAKYNGRIMTDGYSGYDRIFSTLPIAHAACHAHARRYFVEAFETAKDNRAEEVLRFYADLYRLEAMARKENFSEAELLKLRQEKSKPIMNAFRDWLYKRRAKSYGAKGALDKAVNYALNLWPKLVLFLGDAKIPLDNNAAENAIRPFVIGRKNWMISGSPAGAEASCLFYSLVESARLNGHEPYWYLRYLFDRLPFAANDADIERLMPHNLPPQTGIG